MTCDRKRTKRPSVWLAALGWLLAAPVVAELVAESGAESPAPTPLTVLTWGGAYEASQRQAYFAAFTDATGIPIRTVHYDGGLADLRRHLASGDVTWDLVDMVYADALAACDAGLLEPLPVELLAPSPTGDTAREDFLPGAITRCGVAHLVFSTVLAFDERAFPGVKPSSVADFFDLERFPGKRALRRVPVGLMEWALLSYQVPRQQLYNLLSTERGFDLAFRRLDQIRPDLRWWTSGDQPARWLEDGEVAMASGFNGRFFHAQVTRGAPITVIWDGQLLDYNSWAILRGSDQVDEAHRFIRHATRTEAMAALANRISYGPTRYSAQRRVGRHRASGVAMAPHLPTAPSHLSGAIDRDHDWYARTAGLRARRFEAWLKRDGEAQGDAD